MGDSEDPDKTPVMLVDAEADLAYRLADFAAVLHHQSERFAAAARDVRSLTGVRLSAYLLDLAETVGSVTEELHDFRRRVSQAARLVR